MAPASRRAVSKRRADERKRNPPPCSVGLRGGLPLAHPLYNYNSIHRGHGHSIVKGTDLTA
jgi:hypothetical protein